MSAEPPSEHSLPQSPRPKPARVLACVQCQQRKIKCNRKFPCYNCKQHEVQCVPAIQARRRKRRFPEKDLLERLRHYEHLLRQNHVKFDPLHPEAEGAGDADEPSDHEQVDAPPTNPHIAFTAKNLWQAWTQEPGTNSHTSPPIAEVLEDSVKQAWSETAEDDNMLLGTRKTPVDLSTFHPSTVDIFKLWQIYLDNVNPLLKVTHAPTVQVRIIEAVGNISNIPSPFEALLFSVYCMAVFSIEDEQCLSIFATPKHDLLTKYQFGCQQALTNAGFLRSADRDTLTALYLYLLSIPLLSDPRSVCHLLGLAIRIAQCMGIHNESALAKQSPFEAEMRRRLWWSLVIYDARRSEMADHKDSSLSPLWDCRVPLNINDSDLRAEMKEDPTQGGNSTDSMFVFIRSMLADFVRHTASHLEFTNPALKRTAKELPNHGSLAALQERVEKEYLQHCKPDNPLHFVTMWMARAYIAKARLWDHYMSSVSGTFRSSTQLDHALSLALTMIECDTALTTSPLTRGFQWMLRPYFPFPAYMHIIQDLRRRPLCRPASHAWEVLSSNHGARFDPRDPGPTPLARALGRMVLTAWEALEAASTEQPLAPPMVAAIREKEATFTHELPPDATSHGLDLTSDPALSLDFTGDTVEFLGTGFDSFANMGPGSYMPFFDQGSSIPCYNN
ncbi:hypothetical protein S40293_07804 [Stachybotrys chartarum IBT 40293]|nr:hypothetical protein S40293_07804 [Stachybotrys chartarum IBT 40293]